LSSLTLQLENLSIIKIFYNAWIVVNFIPQVLCDATSGCIYNANAGRIFCGNRWACNDAILSEYVILIEVTFEKSNTARIRFILKYHSYNESNFRIREMRLELSYIFACHIYSLIYIFKKLYNLSQKWNLIFYLIFLLLNFNLCNTTAQIKSK